MPTTSTRRSPEPAGTRGRRDLERAVQSDPGSFRILTGDRPTGPLHIGHLFGTLENRVRLTGARRRAARPDRRLPDDHRPRRPVQLPQDVEGLVADYLAVGIDPDRAVIFAHSQVPELNQLILPFLSLISVAELRRNPTVKDEIAMTGGGSTSALMFTYPAHQAADILFCRANLVPVGKDQLPHLELTRTIARRFNERYSPEQPLLPRARGAPQPCAAPARSRRSQDGQEPWELDPARGERRRDGASRQSCEDRLRAADHLRARPPSRGLQPPRDRLAESRASTRGDRERDRRRRARWRSNASSSTRSTSTSGRSAADARSWHGTPATFDPCSSAGTHSRDRSRRQRSGAFRSSCTRPTDPACVRRVEHEIRSRRSAPPGRCGRCPADSRRPRSGAGSARSAPRCSCGAPCSHWRVPS